MSSWSHNVRGWPWVSLGLPKTCGSVSATLAALPSAANDATAKKNVSHVIPRIMMPGGFLILRFEGQELCKENFELLTP